MSTELAGHTTDKKYKEVLDSFYNSDISALKAEDIADVVVYSYNLDQNICVRDLVIAPTKQGH